MKRGTPLGFYVAALCAGCFALFMARAILGLDEWTGGPPLFVRGGALLLFALGAVTTEALWSARPWAYRASLSLALAYAALVALNFGMMYGVSGVFMSLWVLFPSAVVVAPLVAYVRERSMDLFGTRPQARPRPVLRAALRGRWLHHP